MLKYPAPREITARNEDLDGASARTALQRSSSRDEKHGVRAAE
jgi:hypothetical protein